MRNLLVPAIAALLALPALANASGVASAYDDVSYPPVARATIAIEQRDAAPNAYDDAGVSAPAVASPGVAERDLFAEHNPFDDAGIGAPQLAPSPASAPARLADSAPAGCSCCQS